MGIFYKEPKGYIPKSVRKECGLGEYAPKKKAAPKKKTTTKKK